MLCDWFGPEDPGLVVYWVGVSLPEVGVEGKADRSGGFWFILLFAIPNKGHAEACSGDTHDAIVQVRGILETCVLQTSKSRKPYLNRVTMLYHVTSPASFWLGLMADTTRLMVDTYRVYRNLAVYL